MWRMPLHLHVNQKSDYDDYDPPTLIIICFVEKNNIFLRFCLCIFESGTVKSDCPVQIFRKMMKYIKIKYSFTSFTALFWRY